MDSILFNYSEFFNDDGGMDKVKSDFAKLGDDLIADAKRIKKEFSEAFNFDDIAGFKKYETLVEDMLAMSEKYAKTQTELEKISKEYADAQKKLAKQTEKLTEANDELTDSVKDEIKARKQSKKSQVESTKALDDLFVQLEQHKVALKAVNELEKTGAVSVEDAAIARGRAKLMMKELTAEINKQQKELLALNQVSKAEQKLIEANIVLQKEEAKTLNDVRERIAALRVVVQSLDMEAEAEKIKAFNDEINELTDILSDNSDKFIQNKINIGNYEEAINNALKSSNLFKTNIAGLDAALDGLLGGLMKSKQEIQEMEEALGNNANALQKFSISFGKLNKVLKASVIGLILVALAALSSLFGSSRAGAVRMEKVMMSLSSAFITFGKVSLTIIKGVGGALIDFFSGDFSDAGDKLKKTFKDVGEAFKDGTKAIVQGLEYIDKAFKIEDQVRRLSREVERLNGKLAITQLRADDSTRSLKTQLYNAKLALTQQTLLNQKQLEIAKKQLDVANNKVKQNVLANVVEASSLNMQAEGVAFAEQVQKLAQQRGVDLEISNELIDEQQNALLEVIKAENELALGKEENAKKQREINRDIFEQNLDLLIDLIDTEKNISEQYVNDITRNFKKRVDEFNRFILVFRANASRELDEFTKEAANMGLKLKFKIKFDENGDFKVLVNDAELAINDIVKLNEQLQGFGINEIDINRFREFLVETRNGVKDFRDLNKELVLAGINFKQLKNDFAVGGLELSNLERINSRVRELNDLLEKSKTTTYDKKGNAIDKYNISKRDRDKIMKELAELEKERTSISEDADLNRKSNRIAAINEELTTVEKGSQREIELLQEKQDLLKEIEQGYLDDRLNQIKENNEKAELEYKKFVENIQNIIGLILDKLLEVNAKIIQSQEKLVDKQGEMVDKQEERAKNGMQNTLAFEQRALADREAELIKSQKKQERLEKIKALYTSYTNYSNKGDENPILKALRDFAILESIAASFGDGGVVEDKLPSNGIFRGRSHNGKHGGIPILVEGQEGILSKREMANLGKDNFYKMKELAGLGQVDSNFFSGQREQFVQMIVPKSSSDSMLINEMRDVKNAIEKKPVQNLDILKLSDNILEFVETVQSKNKTVRNHYQLRKKRF